MIKIPLVAFNQNEARCPVEYKALVNVLRKASLFSYHTDVTVRCSASAAHTQRESRRRRAHPCPQCQVSSETFTGVTAEDSHPAQGRENKTKLYCRNRTNTAIRKNQTAVPQCRERGCQTQSQNSKHTHTAPLEPSNRKSTGDAVEVK